MSAAENLVFLVDDARVHGRPVPCWRRPEWTAECVEQRALAVVRCGDCPQTIRAACRAAADEAHACWGVWAGVDYSERVNQTWRRTRR
nr:hypothetical protein [Propionibacterium sp.]